MDELIEKLKNWGADTENAVNRVMQDEAFYQSLVVRFAASPEFELLENALKDGNGREAFRLAHSIKGASANLSLTPLYSAVSDLTEDLRKYAMPGGEKLHQQDTEDRQSRQKDSQDNQKSGHLEKFRRERDRLRAIVADSGYL
ncbi:MAG: Hpt domain-containing protein [Bilifractor sp.]